MRSLPIVLMSAGAGAAVGAAAGFALGANGLLLGAAALLAGTSGCAIAVAALALDARRAMEARFETLAQEMIFIRQRQADYENKISIIEQRATELPTQIWEAAASDLQVLGTLVSDLAKTVAKHDAVLVETAPTATVELAEDLASDQRAPAGGFVLPSTSPPPRSWFEEDAEPDDVAATQMALPDVPAEASAPIDAMHAEIQTALVENLEEALGLRQELPAVTLEPATPPPAPVARVQPTVVTALTEDKLEVRLQPYVSLPQRRVLGYEATIAMKDGEDPIGGGGSLADAARVAGKAAEIDRLLIERVGQVLRVLRARNRTVSMTCAVSGASLLDTSFRSAVEAVALAEGKLAENITLSIRASEAADLLPAGRDALESLRRTGVGLGLRATSAAGMDLGLLDHLRARELRLPAGVLIGNDRADIHPSDVSEMLDRRNVKLLITEIESEAVMRDLLDCAAAMGQGSLFGASRPVRPEILQPRPVAEQRAAARVEAARTVNRLEQQGVQRQSFRSLLRRA